MLDGQRVTHTEAEPRWDPHDSRRWLAKSREDAGPRRDSTGTASPLSSPGPAYTSGNRSLHAPGFQAPGATGLFSPCSSGRPQVSAVTPSELLRRAVGRNPEAAKGDPRPPPITPSTRRPYQLHLQADPGS